MRTEDKVKIDYKPQHPSWSYSEALRWGPTSCSSPLKKVKLNQFLLIWAQLDCHWGESKVKRKRDGVWPGSVHWSTNKMMGKNTELHLQAASQRGQARRTINVLSLFHK
jgi:hypothetical protein